MKKYDVAIIGAGPAGLTAGIYAARSGMKTAIISKDIGGTANYILLLENWPGFSGTGTELMGQFYEHAKEYGIEFIMSEAENVEKEKGIFIIKTKKLELEAKSVILATGTDRKKLNIKGEKELIGKGVSYCITCDSFFFKDKSVGVIGGSDCAATSALALSNIAKKVHIIYRGGKLRCEDINSKRLENRKNVEFHYNSIPVEIKGEKRVEKLVVESGGKRKEIDLDGVFIEIGAVPLLNFIKNLGLKLDSEKYIVINENGETNVEGVFAAGDITNRKLKQVVIAAAEGAIAAKSAYDYVSKKN